MPDPNLFTARALRQVLAGGGHRDHRHHPLDHRLDALPPGPDARRRSRRSPRARSATGSSRSSTGARTGSPRWCSSSSAASSVAAGSWDEGLAVERRFLIDSVRVDSTEFSLQDGSGLSSGNLVSPLAFTKILRFIRGASPGADLPRRAAAVGRVGSLQSRFVGTPLEGRVRAKDGSIGGVNSLSGFIERPDGRVWTFSVQANHHTQPGRTVIQAIDSVVVEMGSREVSAGRRRTVGRSTDGHGARASSGPCASDGRSP